MIDLIIYPYLRYYQVFVVTTHYGNCFYTCQILSVGEITLNYDVSVFAFQKVFPFREKHPVTCCV